MSAVVVLGIRILLVVALYAFLGSALWVMWKELRQTSERVAGGQIPPIRLESTLRGGDPVLSGIFPAGSHSGPRSRIRHGSARRGRLGAPRANQLPPWTVVA